MDTSTTSTVSIQPAQGETVGEYDVHKPLPYPFHIEPDGSVARQDFWQGTPARLAGFQVDPKVMKVEIFDFQWLADLDTVERVVGMHAVFIDSSGSMWTDRRPVERVTVHAAPTAVSA